MVDLMDVMLAVVAQLRDLERQLPAATTSEWDELAREIEAGEQVMERFARKGRLPSRLHRKLN